MPRQHVSVIDIFPSDGDQLMRAYEARLRGVGVTAGIAVVLCATLSQPAGAAPKSGTASHVTTCATVGTGAQGRAVKTLQKAVGATADGDYGPATQKAVRKWQKGHSLPATGVVDAATWSKLPTKVGAKACGQHVHGGGVSATCARLGVGTSGLAVVVLQTAIGATPDGEFGPATQQALKKVQRDSKLKASGVATAKTWHALHRLGTPACSNAHSAGPPPPKDAKAQARIHARVQRLVNRLEQKPGTSKNRVALQAMAFARKQIGKPYVYGGTGPKGYDCSGLQMKAYLHAALSIPRVAADQYAGAGTQISLDHAKQGDLVFFATDVAKPSTVHHVAMYVGGGNVLDAPYTGANVRIVPLWTSDLLPVAVRPAAALTLPLKAGASGWSVTQLQQALNRHHARIPVDGGYGSSTRQAVRAWQQKKGLKPNGVVRMTTWLSLG
jgi:cell wall-associated NlpC family hydrolase